MAADVLAGAHAALAEGRWNDARRLFEEVLADAESADACFGLAVALWWLGESQLCVDRCQRAYTLSRRAGVVELAVQCASWLAITYKANFANFVAANGWLGRADRLLEHVETGPLHGWAWVARGYRAVDLVAAEDLTERALAVARATGDVDLELVALSQLGLVRVGQGRTAAGFALIDEAMAAALAGERTTLDTVVYTCCDMLNACELASDAERAAQWCAVADGFVRRYGCPFLYAECRVYYGSLLAAQGRWADAERELTAGLRITDGTCPGMHGRALTRLAGLWIRQGRLEDAERLLCRAEESVEAAAEGVLTWAALLLARGDAPAATRGLEQRLGVLTTHRAHLATALDLLVDAHLVAGNTGAAGAAALRLTSLTATVDDARLAATAAAAAGRVAGARGDVTSAVGHLEAAVARWADLGLPFELARTRVELGRVLASSQPAVAIDHARRALAAFGVLGASVEADRTAAFLRSLGVTARVGPKGAGALTVREQDVLRLLGEGLSNPEIGARLHISRKTAAHHVSSILTKLNLRNRAEAAAHAGGGRATNGAGP